MAHTQIPHSPSSTSTDAEAYQEAQQYGRALIRVRTERENMGVPGSFYHQLLIEDPHPRTWSRLSMRRLALQDSNDADDKKFTRKLLWWHARVITGKFLPAEIMGMILGALYPRLGSKSDTESDCSVDSHSAAEQVW